MAVTERWGGLRLEPYDPRAVDADNDGIVQEGTAWERPVGTRLLDRLGREIAAGATSPSRDGSMRVMRGDREETYTPSYGAGRAKPQGAPSKPTPLSAATGARSLREMGLRSVSDISGSVQSRLETRETPTPTPTPTPQVVTPDVVATPQVAPDDDTFDALQATASALHEEWRKGRRRPDGTFEPRMKDDGKGGQVDIANTPFDQLPPKWQEENLRSAESALEVLRANPEQTIEMVAQEVHRAWMDRNKDWAPPEQMVPYGQLPEVEKEKDRVVARIAKRAHMREVAAERRRRAGGKGSPRGSVYGRPRTDAEQRAEYQRIKDLIVAGGGTLTFEPPEEGVFTLANVVRKAINELKTGTDRQRFEDILNPDYEWTDQERQARFIYDGLLTPEGRARIRRQLDEIDSIIDAYESMSDEEIVDLVTKRIRAGLADEDTRIAVYLPSRKFDSFIANDGVYLTTHEVGQGAATEAFGRAKIEEETMGIPRSLDDDVRPASGIVLWGDRRRRVRSKVDKALAKTREKEQLSADELTPEMSQELVHAQSGGAAQYGDVQIVLRRGVMGRARVANGDTYDQKPVPADIEGSTDEQLAYAMLTKERTAAVMLAGLLEGEGTSGLNPVSVREAFGFDEEALQDAFADERLTRVVESSELTYQEAVIFGSFDAADIEEISIPAKAFDLMDRGPIAEGPKPEGAAQSTLSLAGLRDYRRPELNDVLDDELIDAIGALSATEQEELLAPIRGRMQRARRFARQDAVLAPLLEVNPEIKINITHRDKSTMALLKESTKQRFGGDSKAAIFGLLAEDLAEIRKRVGLDRDGRDDDTSVMFSPDTETKFFRPEATPAPEHAWGDAEKVALFGPGADLSPQMLEDSRHARAIVDDVFTETLQRAEQQTETARTLLRTMERVSDPRSDGSREGLTKVRRKGRLKGAFDSRYQHRYTLDQDGEIGLRSIISAGKEGRLAVFASQVRTGETPDQTAERLSLSRELMPIPDKELTAIVERYEEAWPQIKAMADEHGVDLWSIPYDERVAWLEQFPHATPEMREAYKAYKEANARNRGILRRRRAMGEERVSALKDLMDIGGVKLSKKVDISFSGHPEELRAQTEELLDSVADRFPTAWLEALETHERRTGKRLSIVWTKEGAKDGRSSYWPGSHRIVMSLPDTDRLEVGSEGYHSLRGTMAHELVHAFEAVIPELKLAQHLFHAYRTSGDERSVQYSTSEHVLLDSYAEAYMGHTGHGVTGMSSTSHFEIISTALPDILGFQRGNSQVDREVDTETADFLLGVMLATSQRDESASSRSRIPAAMAAGDRLVERRRRSRRGGDAEGSMFSPLSPDSGQGPDQTAPPDSPQVPLGERGNPIDLSGWKQVGPQAGSNPGGVYEDDQGNRYYIKLARTPAHAENERLASLLYQRAGLDAVGVMFGMKDGVLHTVSPMRKRQRDDMTLADYLDDESVMDAIREGFAVDAWLSNWDVVGDGVDNIIVDENGDPVRVDPGGALMWRARGEAKGDMFTDNVTELETLRDSSRNRASASVFKGTTDDQIRAGVKRVADISPEEIDEIVDRVVSDPDNRELLKTRLKNRRLDLIDRFGKDGPKAKPRPALTGDITPEARKDVMELIDGIDISALREDPDKIDVDAEQPIDLTDDDARRSIRSEIESTSSDSPSGQLLEKLMDEFDMAGLIVRKEDDLLGSYLGLQYPDDSPDDESWTEAVRRVVRPKVTDVDKQKRLDSLLGQYDAINELSTVISRSLPGVDLSDDDDDDVDSWRRPVRWLPPELDANEAADKIDELLATLDSDMRESILSKISAVQGAKRSQEQRSELISRIESVRRQLRDRVLYDNPQRFQYFKKAEEAAKTPAVTGKALQPKPELDADAHLPTEGITRSVDQLTDLANGTLVKGGSLVSTDEETIRQAIDALTSQELKPILDRLLALAGNPNRDDSDVLSTNEFGYEQHISVELTSALAKMRGFDAPALKVSSDELDDLIVEGGFHELRRGGALVPQQEHISGQMLYGTGISGAGYYFAIQTFMGAGDDNEVSFDAGEYAGGSVSEGAVLRGGLNPAARIGSIGEMERATWKWVLLKQAFQDPDKDHEAVFKREADPKDEPEAVVKLLSMQMTLFNMAKGDGPEAERARRALELLDTMINPDLVNEGSHLHANSFIALLLGYDGIESGLSPRPGVTRDNRVLLFNRSAVVVQDDLMAKREHEESVGRDKLIERIDERRAARGQLMISASTEEQLEYVNRIIELIAGGEFR